MKIKKERHPELDSGSTKIDSGYNYARINKLIRLVTSGMTLLAILILLSACGVKGDLELPEGKRRETVI